MPNVAQIFQNQCDQSYQRDGAHQAHLDLPLTAGQNEEFGDGLTRAVALLTDNTVTALKTSAGRLYEVVMESPAASTVGSFLQIFDATVAGTTLGTTGTVITLFCAGGKTLSVRFYENAPAGNTIFATAISYAVTTTARGSTASAAADRPTLKFMYA